MKELENENVLLREKIESLFSLSVSRYVFCLLVFIVIYLFRNCVYFVSENKMENKYLLVGWVN